MGVHWVGQFDRRVPCDVSHHGSEVEQERMGDSDQLLGLFDVACSMNTSTEISNVLNLYTGGNKCVGRWLESLILSILDPFEQFGDLAVGHCGCLGGLWRFSNKLNLSRSDLFAMRSA